SVIVCFIRRPQYVSASFFLNAPAPSGIYTLSLHDALPIWEFYGLLGWCKVCKFSHKFPYFCWRICKSPAFYRLHYYNRNPHFFRSEEHTSELQSRFDLVCRLLLEKKKSDDCALRTLYIVVD